jgi:hypothetical protein
METAQQDPSQARRFGLILRACLVGITRGRHRPDPLPNCRTSIDRHFSQGRPALEPGPTAEWSWLGGSGHRSLEARAPTAAGYRN